jgi:hypothetical protein
VVDAPVHSPYDGARLKSWVRAVLPQEEETFDDRSMHAGVLEASPGLLRRFCQLRGIEIPYRLETRLGQKERGLVQCLEEILASSRTPNTVLIVSDLCGIMNTELIVRGLRLAQARRHRVAFVAPYTPDYVQPRRDTGREAVLHELFSLAEADDRSHVISAIESLGIPVISVGPADTIGMVFRRLRPFGWR